MACTNQRDAACWRPGDHPNAGVDADPDFSRVILRLSRGDWKGPRLWPPHTVEKITCPVHFTVFKACVPQTLK
jgi:hypothetical protein